MTLLDMTGKPCPIPVIEAKKALNTAAPGDIVSVLVDNDISRQNLQKMAKGLGHEFSYEKRDDGNFLIAIKASDVSCRLDDDGAGLMVAIGRDYMGGASEELGRALMKSFIYSLTELDTPPEHILFYNGGVLLTTEGSAVLDDLAILANKGSQIVSCGLCLNYYKLTDKLAIGQVTNMYAATLAMAHAAKLINL
jgi:selenium metabolism protein YedF